MALFDRQPARLLLLTAVLLCAPRLLHADARFDLIGPKIDVSVTRNGVTLPIASVPNLQPGDRLWVHPDLPASQSVHYLLICVFLRGNTNPPPDEWFTRIETWDRKVREEGAFVTVPEEAQQAVLLMAPETGGDFSTLKSAIKGRPGAFVRASQDLTEAGFEQARIEKYIAEIRKVPPSDPAELQKHSDLLARTLALKPNADCFKRPVDVQFTCLTQTGSQIVLDDGHGQTIVNALANGPNSDFINQASYTQALGAGVYSAYVGAIVDLVRIMGNLHTAQYQYIPAISFPQQQALNLRLNTPPSFHNPKSVLVIALPSVQKAVQPPLRPADAHEVACLLKPSVVLPIEGAPLVFSTDFAHQLVLHLNTPPGAPAEPDIPLLPDAYSGGLALQQTTQHHIPLRDPLVDAGAAGAEPGVVPLAPEHRPAAAEAATRPKDAAPTRPEPVLLTGTIQGRWGFDAYTGPTVQLQQLPGSDWRILPPGDAASSATNLIAGHTAQLLLVSTGTACVHTITARPAGVGKDMTIAFKPEAKPADGAAALASAPAQSGPQEGGSSSPAATPQPLPLALTLPLEHALTPGGLHLAIQQYEQPKADEVSMRTFAEPATVSSIELHAGDKTMLLQGARLDEIASLGLGDLTFLPAPQPGDVSPATPASISTLHLALPADAPAPPTHVDERLTAKLTLKDGRTLTAPLTVSAPRPVITLLHKTVAPPAGSVISLANPDDLPLNAVLTFTLKSPNPFPRNGQVEIETLDGTLRTVLTLAPSGGLLLQDPHTVVATLDPLRSFGPSAFGALHLRAVYPPAVKGQSSRTEPAPAASNSPTGRPEPAASASSTQPAATAIDGHTPEALAAAPEVSASDWLPLATLVRLPALTLLQCPSDITQPCTITGSNLFLLDSLSADPTFANPVAVPDGYTGDTLTVPHPAAATVFLKLRDDAATIDSAILPTPAPAPVVAHLHGGHKASTTPASSTTTPAPAAVPAKLPETAPATPADQTPSIAAPPAPAKQEGPASTPGPAATPPSQ
jgi:hypothetical protein